MYSSLHKEQISTLNNLSQFIVNNPLTNILNDSLERNNILAVFNFLNQITADDFIKFQSDKKLIIKNPLLSKFLKCNLVLNKQEYLDSHIQYTNKYNYNQALEDKYISSSFWSNHQNIEIFINNGHLISSILNQPFNFINNHLEQYESGKVIQDGEYLFSKNAFNDTFNEKFLDYMKNYHLYLNHPRVGKIKLNEVAKEIMSLNIPDISYSVLINFEHYALEFIPNKKINKDTKDNYVITK